MERDVGRPTGDVERLLSWWEASASSNGGLIPAFTNADAMAVLGKLDPRKYGRAHGQVQSRIDFACFKCNIPPLGLAADKPFGNAWAQEGRPWEFPVDAMMAAAQSRHWVPADFRVVRETASSLRGSAAALWRAQLNRDAEAVRLWAESFLLGVGEPRVRHVPKKAALRIDWTWDELILALDLYFCDYRERSADDKHPKVQALSRQLNQLGRILGIATTSEYRNPSGVAMKLLNFSSLDPTKTVDGRRGLRKGSKLDAAVWQEFVAKPVDLHRTAEAIRSKIKEFVYSTEIAGADEPGITVASEGRLLTRVHRVYERSSALIAKCKDEALKRNGRLACAACAFDFGEAYGEDAGHVIDCHHTKPVHTLGDDGQTDIADLVLLCPNCHRLVHSFRPWLTLDQVKLKVAASQEKKKALLASKSQNSFTKQEGQTTPSMSEGTQFQSD